MALTRRQALGAGGGLLLAAAAPPPWPGMTASGRVAVEGGTVAWRRFGGGPKTPLLLIHGGPGVPSDYLDPLSALGDERPVFVWDQLGCGRSDHPTDPRLWTRARFVDEMTRVRRALGLDQVHLLGHSWGATLAVDHLRAVGQVGVQSLILAGPLLDTARYLEDSMVLLRTLDPHTQAAISAAIQLGRFDTPAFKTADSDYASHFLSRRPQPATKPLLDWTLGHLAQSVYETMWGPAEYVCTGSLRSLDLVPVLPRLRTPTLYVSGEYDECTPDASRFFASHMPNALVETIPGAAHLTTIDAPDEMNRITCRFINGRDRH